SSPPLGQPHNHQRIEFTGVMSLARRALDQEPVGQPILDQDNLAATIISTCTINGKVVILSRCGDPKWRLVGQPTNKGASEQYVD
ncbi:hypothetical protein C1X54_38345, partial [Pseudomonas sp. GW460-13]